MNYSQLDYFLMVAECGSFSDAAERLYVSQPAVSKQIHLLEAEWGISLFYRRYRSISLTEAGELMLEHVRLSRIALQTALEQARQVEQSHKRIFFSIGLFEHFRLGNMCSIIKDFSKRNPTVSISMENNNFYSLIEGLNSSKFDLIFTLEHMITNKNLIETRQVMTARHVAYLSKEHPLCAKPDLKFSDLHEECFFIPSTQQSSLTYNSCKSICLSHGFTPPAFKMVPNIETALIAVRMEEGAVLLDDKVMLESTSDLVQIPTQSYSPMVLAWLKNNSNPLLPLISEEILDHFTPS